MRRGSMMSRILNLVLVTLLIGLLGLTACEKEKRGPVELVGEEKDTEIKAVMGQEGGSLSFAGGGVKFEIPAKLLQEDVTIILKREESTFDLSGKDVVGKAYRISPRLTFAPGAARLHVPVDRPLPGLAKDIDLMVYQYDKLERQGPGGPTLVQKWQPYSKVKFAGYSSNQKYLLFDVYETISDRTTNPPFGLFQVAFDVD